MNYAGDTTVNLTKSFKLKTVSCEPYPITSNNGVGPLSIPVWLYKTTTKTLKMPTAPAKAIYPTACYFTVLANYVNTYTTMALDTPTVGDILLTFVPTTLTNDSFGIKAYYTE